MRVQAGETLEVMLHGWSPGFLRENGKRENPKGI